MQMEAIRFILLVTATDDYFRLRKTPTEEPLYPGGFMRSLTTAFGFLILVTLIGAGSARGDSLSSFAYTWTQQLGATCDQNTTGTTPASCYGEWTAALGDGATTTFGGNGYAAAGFGILHSGSSGVASCNVPANFNCYGVAGGANSSASFEDTFNITGGPASGFLDLSVVADGTGEVTCIGPQAAAACASSFGYAQLGAGNPVFFNGIREQGIGLSPGTNDINVWFPFAAVDGVAQVTNGLSLLTGIQCYVADNTSCSAYVNFSDTAYVAGLSVLDANGNPVSGAIVTAESGTDYNGIQVPAPVPEPSTLLLMSTAFLGYCIVRNRRGAS
jgi:hypothetical protein